MTGVLRRLGFCILRPPFFRVRFDFRRGGRAAEGNGLLNRRRGKTSTQGSNPCLSAKRLNVSRRFNAPRRLPCRSPALWCVGRRCRSDLPRSLIPQVFIRLLARPSEPRFLSFRPEGEILDLCSMQDSSLRFGMTQGLSFARGLTIRPIPNGEVPSRPLAGFASRWTVHPPRSCGAHRYGGGCDLGFVRKIDRRLCRVCWGTESAVAHHAAQDRLF